MVSQRCTRCVMDNLSDRTIRFKNDGTCSYCNYALSRMGSVYYPNEVGEQKLERMINKIKEYGRNKEFDCIMGISGGLDSSYLAYLGSKWGLHILAIHIDDGFDTEVAKQNIRNLCNQTNMQLAIETPDEKQYMDVIKSFIRAGVPNIAIPQDNVLLACLYKYVKEYKIKYFLSGANFALESILEGGNTHYHADGVHIKDIHKHFGDIPLTTLPLTTIFERYLGYNYISGVRTLRPLDLINYNRESAIQELHENIGFDYYGGKHCESIFTRFMQVYYLPKKFNVDKRKSHLSSLIVSGQVNREEALNELDKPLYDDNEMENDIMFILQKIGMKRDEFDKIMAQKGVSHLVYKKSKLIALSGLGRKFRGLLSN